MDSFYYPFDIQQPSTAGPSMNQFCDDIDQFLHESRSDPSLFGVPEITYYLDMDPFSPFTPDSISSMHSPYDLPESPYAGVWADLSSAQRREDSDIGGAVSPIPSLDSMGSVSNGFPSPDPYSSDESVQSIATNDSSVLGTSNSSSWAIESNLSEWEPAIAQSLPRSKRDPKRRFNCPKCSEAILNKNKTEHMKTHSHKRPRFYCSHSSCSRSYTRTHDLHRHIQKDHAGNSTKRVNTSHRRRFRCDACRKTGFEEGQEGCGCGYDVIFTY